MFLFFIIEHHYRSSAPAPENERTMIFYNEARVDGLMKRVETPTEMTKRNYLKKVFQQI
jgi:hypothetical protein